MLNKLSIFLTILVLNTEIALAETYVTTYVTKVQEQRRSTRWTLTEWLRIKERMKMMDVWLAMFSNPKEDKFSPELNLMYGQSRGNFKTADGEHSSLGYLGRVQVWLTNLFTGATGARMLNVDFGIEAYLRGYNVSGTDELATTATESNFEWQSGTQTYFGNFRLFGKNIQDSSLSLKIGQYNNTNDFTSNSPVYRGTAGAAELQLYVFKWLGLEGHYTNYSKSASAADGSVVSGQAYDYWAYVEVSLFRMMLGRYHESWEWQGDDGEVSETDDNGMMAAVKLQI